jgi:trk system potassium uptake protein
VTKPVSRSEVEDAPLPPLSPEGPAGRGGARAFAWMLTAYLVLMAVAVVIIRLGVVTAAGGELSLDRTIFTSINAATLTGFQMDVGINASGAGGRIGGPLLLLALTLGGIAISLVAGGIAVVRVVRLPYSDRQVVLAAGAATLIAVLAGATALADHGPVQALFDAASAFGNSGLHDGRLPALASWQAQTVLLPLALLGGLGLPVLMELFDRVTLRRRISAHSMTVLGASAVVYVAGIALLVYFQGLSRPDETPWPGHTTWRRLFASASAMAVNSRTAGLPLESVRDFARAAQWIIVLLMAVGAGPAGTAGGLKLTTLVLLGAGVRNVLHRRAVGRGFGIAAAWLGTYAAVVFAGFLLMLATQPDAPADRLLFLCVSAMSNVGLSHDPVSIIGPGLYVLSSLMLLGRILPLLVLWWMVRATEGEAMALG